MRLAAAALLGLVLSAPAGAEDGFAVLEGHGGPVKHIALSPDGSIAATASFDYSAGLWEVETARHLRWLDGHQAAVNTAAFTPDGRRLVTGGDDFALIVWTVATGAIEHRLEGHRAKIVSVAVAPGGTIAATAAWDGRIGLWDIDAARNLGFLDGHQSKVNAVRFSSDGRTLWSAADDGTIRRWDMERRALDRIEASHGFGVNLIALAEADGWLAYGAVDGAVRVIDLATGAEIADVAAGRRPVLGLALSPDRRTLAIGDGEGFINLVSTADWRPIRDFRAVPNGPVWALAFTGDGKRLVSGGLDSRASIWPVLTAQSVAELEALSGERSGRQLSNGERQFLRRCSICHTLTPGSARRAGPTLYGLFGRVAGSVEDYAYSDALKTAAIIWSGETVDRLFEVGPDRYLPGTKMPTQRVASPQDRTDLIDYLKQATKPPERIQ